MRVSAQRSSQRSAVRICRDAVGRDTRLHLDFGFPTARTKIASLLGLGRNLPNFVVNSVGRDHLVDVLLCLSIKL